MKWNEKWGLELYRAFVDAWEHWDTGQLGCFPQVSVCRAFSIQRLTLWLERETPVCLESSVHDMSIALAKLFFQAWWRNWSLSHSFTQWKELVREIGPFPPVLPLPSWWPTSFIFHYLCNGGSNVSRPISSGTHMGQQLRKEAGCCDF